MKTEWTAERIAELSKQDIKQLRSNAERLNEPELTARCDEALKATRRPATRAARIAGGARPRTKARRLIARISAFEARGVWLLDPRTSWGGVRKSDGTVVLALWADAVGSAEGGCSYLLWRPNTGGEWPWADKAGGKERFAHCQRAIEAGRAEGLLVYGQAIAGSLPEDKAYTIHGVDAEIVLSLRVEQRGAAYWAVWGKTARPARG